MYTLFCFQVVELLSSTSDLVTTMVDLRINYILFISSTSAQTNIMELDTNARMFQSI